MAPACRHLVRAPAPGPHAFCMITSQACCSPAGSVVLFQLPTGAYFPARRLGPRSGHGRAGRRDGEGDRERAAGPGGPAHEPRCGRALTGRAGSEAALDQGAAAVPAQGSLITAPQAPAAEAALAGLRGALRQALRGAWSREAVRRGIALARRGAHQEALECYDQARAPPPRGPCCEPWTLPLQCLHQRDSHSRSLREPTEMPPQGLGADWICPSPPGAPAPPESFRIDPLRRLTGPRGRQARQGRLHVPGGLPARAWLPAHRRPGPLLSRHTCPRFTSAHAPCRALRAAPAGRSARGSSTALLLRHQPGCMPWPACSSVASGGCHLKGRHK